MLQSTYELACVRVGGWTWDGLLVDGWMCVVESANRRQTRHRREGGRRLEYDSYSPCRWGKDVELFRNACQYERNEGIGPSNLGSMQCTARSSTAALTTF